MGNKYFLVTPRQGNIICARKLWFEEGFVVFEAMNYKTGQITNIQWHPKDLIQSIVKYDNWQTFSFIVDQLILQASADRAKQATKEVIPPMITLESAKKIIEQFPSNVPNIEPQQAGQPAKA